jgi:hypothetical protein
LTKPNHLLPNEEIELQLEKEAIKSGKPVIDGDIMKNKFKQVINIKKDETLRSFTQQITEGVCYLVSFKMTQLGVDLTFLQARQQSLHQTSMGV